MIAPIYRLAPPEMDMSNRDSYTPFRGIYELSLPDVTFCSRNFLNQLIREAFEKRTHRHYIAIWHKPDPERGGNKYEGAKILAWTSADGEYEDARIQITIAPNAVPINEIVELQFNDFGPEND